MDGHEISDGIVALRRWSIDDAPWYAATVTGDQLIQQFTAELPTVTAEDVRSAISDSSRNLTAQPTSSSRMPTATSGSATSLLRTRTA